MSKTILLPYNVFVESRKEKLANMLISEIIFLKTRVKRANHKDDILYLNAALNKLEYLLNKLKTNSADMSEEVFDKIIIIIYHIFKEITDKLE